MLRVIRFLAFLLACGVSCTGLAAESAIAPKDLAARLNAPDRPLILDVRTPAEYRSGHVPHAVNIPYDRIDAQWPGRHVPPEREIVVYCGTGRRAGIAQQSLQALGYVHARLLQGSFNAWQAAHLPTSKSD